MYGCALRAGLRSDVCLSIGARGVKGWASRRRRAGCVARAIAFVFAIWGCAVVAVGARHIVAALGMHGAGGGVCVLWWWCGLWCGGMTAVGRLMLVCRGARGCVRGCRRCRRLRADARWCCQARGRVVAVATYARRCDVCYCGGVFGGAWRAVALDGSGAVGASRRRVIVYSAVVAVIAEDTAANAVGMCVVLWRVGVARDAPLLVPYACTNV